MANSSMFVLPMNHGVGFAQPADDLRIVGWYVSLQNPAGAGRRLAARADDVLHGNGKPGELAQRFAGAAFFVDQRGLLQRAFAINVEKRLDLLVVRGDLIEKCSRQIDGREFPGRHRGEQLRRRNAEYRHAVLS